MQELWQKNKKLLIQALAAMVVFLIVSNIARSIRADHESDLVRHREDAQILAQRLHDLDGIVDVENRRVVEIAGVVTIDGHPAANQEERQKVDRIREIDSLVEVDVAAHESLLPRIRRVDDPEVVEVAASSAAFCAFSGR